MKNPALGLLPVVLALSAWGEGVDTSGLGDVRGSLGKFKADRAQAAAGAVDTSSDQAPPDWRKDWEGTLRFFAAKKSVPPEQYQGSGLRLYALLADRKLAGTAADDSDKLFRDTDLAIDAFEFFTKTKASFVDTQDFASLDFYMKQGEAKFNPNGTQTSALKAKLDRLMKEKTIAQAEVVFEALLATEGNLPLAAGSLAELFCWNRAEYIHRVWDMEDAYGKNYYRFAGLFIGTHGSLIRSMGESAAYANIVGNPIVYAGAEIIQWWGAVFKTGRAPSKQVDTLKTLGPDGNGNLVDKIPELRKGMQAAEKLRSARSIPL